MKFYKEKSKIKNSKIKNSKTAKKLNKYIDKSKAKKKEKYSNIEYDVFSNIIFTIKNMIEYNKIIIVYLLINIIGMGIIEFLPLYTFKNIINNIQNNISITNFIIIVLVGYGLMGIVSGINCFTMANIWWRLIGVRLSLIKKRVAKVLNMSYEEIESPNMQNRCQQAIRATESNNNGVEGMMHSIHEGMINLFKIIISFVVILKLNQFLLFGLVIICFLSYLNIDYAKKRDRELYWKPSIPYLRKQYYMEQKTNDFAYAKDIRLFSMESWLLLNFEQVQVVLHRFFVDSKNRWIKVITLNNFITIVEEGLIYFYLIYSVLCNNMSVDEFILNMGVINIMFDTLSNIFDNYANIRQFSREINDFRSFVEYTDCKDCVIKKDIPNTGEYEVVFENVTFHYPESKKNILENINLTIKAGEKIAVVGVNGSGKTTFVKLLCGLYTPSEGRILLNGIDIRYFDSKEYYLLFAPIFQNFQMFAFTIEENISMKLSGEINDKQVDKSLESLDLKMKIGSLRKGKKTQLFKIIDEDGVDLSGGEKQKLALARAIYKDAPIVILDEPTSALDPLSEDKFYKNLDKIIGNKITIYISHRLSSTRFCDKIVMFESGKIVEYGTHDTLMKARNSYFRMYNIQSHYYKKGEYNNE